MRSSTRFAHEPLDIVDGFGHDLAVHVEALGGIGGHPFPVAVLESDTGPPGDDSEPIVEGSIRIPDAAGADVRQAGVRECGGRHQGRFSPITTRFRPNYLELVLSGELFLVCNDLGDGADRRP